MSNDLQYKAERKVAAAKIALMRHENYAMWSGILMLGQTTVREDCPTAMTNGRDEVYGRDFVLKLTPKELAFVVLHENLHKAFRHLVTWRPLYDREVYSVDPETGAQCNLANIACDFVINGLLVSGDPEEKVIAMPKDKDTGKVMGCYDKKFDGLNAKQVFDMLLQDNPPQPQDGNGQGKGKGKGQKGGNSVMAGSGFDQHDWDGAKEMTKAELEELRAEIDNAIRQGQIAHGRMFSKTGAGEMDVAIGELLYPEVPWEELLREFVVSHCQGHDTSSWRRVNRRFIGSDIYLPSLISEKVGHIVIGVDTSGSVADGEITKGLSEIAHIAETVNPQKVDLLYWDTRIAAHEEYFENDVQNIVSSTKPKGRGGTDVLAMMHYMKEKNIKPQCTIIFTDGGIGDWGSAWETPVLWVIINNKNCTAPVGQTIHVTSDK
jgi:predicted metal-dependent peptidase